MNAAILDTIEPFEGRFDDFTAQTYELLFARYPDYLEMFVLDVDGGVQRSMMRTSIEIITSYATGAQVNNRLEGARLNHFGYGVTDEIFDQFFDVLHEIFQRHLGEAWGDDHQRAWLEMRQSFAATAG